MKNKIYDCITFFNENFQVNYDHLKENYDISNSNMKSIILSSKIDKRIKF